MWYNNVLHKPGGKRNEVRITRLGGASSPLLDMENTGALAIFAFQGTTQRESALQCRVWICRSSEDDVIESRWGPVEPGQWQFIDFDRPVDIPRPDAPCWLQPDDIPETWLANYPSGEEIIRKAVELTPLNENSVDKRLTKRRKCEFEIFQSLEEAVELPSIQRGFSDLTSFIRHANSILRRRKSRSGRSLDLCAKSTGVTSGTKSSTLALSFRR